MSLATGEPSTSSSTQWLQSFSHIEFSEIKTATENFDESLVIGSGGFGKVYKGKIPTEAGLVVAAIKRLDPDSSQGPKEFWAEVKTLSKLHHENIVSLIGYCIHEQEKILVYEYVPNGSLDDHLYKLGTPLSWLLRLNICIGAGHGLRYMHNDVGVDSGIIHRDFKSSNILLSNQWTAKISDFGLSKTCPTNQLVTHVNTLVKGTHGYFDPSYYETGQLTRKSDVFAFGVVMLEVLCRKPSVDRSLPEWRNLVVWVQDSIKEGNLKHIIDSNIRHEISRKGLKTFVRLAERCLHNNSKKRPTMAEVVVNLESILVLQKKLNTSLQSPSKTIFNLFPLPSNRKNSVQGDINGKNIRITPNPVRRDDCMFPADFSNPSPNPSLKEFWFDDLKKCTREFSADLLLGMGGFGVFLGWVDETMLTPSIHGGGIAVAVKRLSPESSLGYAEWLAQVNILGHIDHPNIIKLLGYCIDEHEYMEVNYIRILLVYKYMPNKSFNRFLHGDDIVEPLSWETRILIMTRVARGLTYLHSRNIIFRVITSSIILVDEDFNAKLGVFSSVKYGPEIEETHVSTLVEGSIGYLDPHYLYTGQLTKKTDIYSFGVVLLECITGQNAFDVNRPDDQRVLVMLATQLQSERRNVMEIIDPRLEYNSPLEDVSKCFELALRCVAEFPTDRPSAVEVLQSLEQIYA